MGSRLPQHQTHEETALTGLQNPRVIASHTCSRYTGPHSAQFNSHAGRKLVSDCKRYDTHPGCPGNTQTARRRHSGYTGLSKTSWADSPIPPYKTQDMKALVLASLLCIAASCKSGPPTAEELANADYGNPISQEDAESLAEGWLNQYLKDPMSAQIQWQPVSPGWFRDAPIAGGGLNWGYKLDGSVNAKNSFGGYVGARPYYFMFYNGVLKHVYGQKDLDGMPYVGKLQ